MKTIWRNTVTGRIRLTEPPELDGWEKVSPDQLTKASERIMLDLETIKVEQREQEERFRKELDEVTKSRIVKPEAGGEKKPEPVSFRKIVRGLSLGDWSDAEYEKTILVPSEEARGQRVQAAGVDPTGGYIVPQEYLPGEFIELLRANAVAYQLPVRRLDGLTSSPIVLPQQTGAATAYWTAENAAITASTVTVGQKSMEPHALTALCKTSNRLIRMSDPSIESLLREDIAAQLAIELSRAFFYGTGASNEPLGLANTTGITTDTLTATVVPGDYLDGLEKIELSNVVPDSSTAIVLHPTEWAQLRQSTSAVQAGIQRPATSGVFPMMTKELAGIPIYTSTQITSGQSFIGVWRHAIIGTWGGLEFMASPHAGTAFAANQTWIRAVMDVDFLFRQPSAFCKSA